MARTLGRRSAEKFNPSLIDSVKSAPESEGKQRLLARFNADKKRVDSEPAYLIYPIALETVVLWQAGHRIKHFGFNGLIYEGMSAQEFTAVAKLHGYGKKKRQQIWPWMHVACDEERSFYHPPK